MGFLIDENMPRSLCARLRQGGFEAEDVRDIGLQGCPDNSVLEAATSRNSTIITRDRGFADTRAWPNGFDGGVVIVNLPETSTASEIVTRVMSMLVKLKPEVLYGSITVLEPRRALSRKITRAK